MEMVGGCVVHERVLLMPPAQLRTACIALVATHADFRGRGVARAVMEHVIETAHAARHDLLLLGGIPNFYDQFGFVDIFDATEHLIDRRQILWQPPSPCSVRTATPEDAVTLLELYERHYQRYTGSFTRSLARQAHQLRFRSPENPAFLALTPEGWPCGYLLCGDDGARGTEVAADSWPAALALLQTQAQLLEARPDPPAELVWAIPPASPTLYHLLDNLPFSYTPPLPPYPHWYVVRSQQRHLPFAGSMARPAHLPKLVRNLLPRWRMLRQRYSGGWAGVLHVVIGDEEFLLEITPDDIELVDRPAGKPLTVRLDTATFTQLLFGFRPVVWAAQRPAQHIPHEAMPLLEILFPIGHTWFAASDAF
jgi:hypothetical protein